MKPSLLPLLLPLTPMSGMIFRSEWGKAPAFWGGVELSALNHPSATGWLVAAPTERSVKEEAGEQGEGEQGEVFSWGLIPHLKPSARIKDFERGLIPLFHFAPRQKGRKHSPCSEAPFPPASFGQHERYLNI